MSEFWVIATLVCLSPLMSALVLAVLGMCRHSSIASRMEEREQMEWAKGETTNG